MKFTVNRSFNVVSDLNKLTPDSDRFIPDHCYSFEKGVVVRVDPDGCGGYYTRIGDRPGPDLDPDEFKAIKGYLDEVTD